MDKKKTGIKGKINFFNKGAKQKTKAIKGKYKLVCRTSEEVRTGGKRGKEGKENRFLPPTFEGLRKLSVLVRVSSVG